MKSSVQGTMNIIAWARGSKFRNPQYLPKREEDMLDSADAIIRTLTAPAFDWENEAEATGIPWIAEIYISATGSVVLTIPGFGHFHGNTIADAANQALPALENYGIEFEWMPPLGGKDGTA